MNIYKYTIISCTPTCLKYIERRVKNYLLSVYLVISVQWNTFYTYSARYMKNSRFMTKLLCTRALKKIDEMYLYECTQYNDRSFEHII